LSHARPKVLLVCNQNVRERYVTSPDLDRLARFADFDWLESTVTGGSWTETPDDPAATARVVERVRDIDALIVCHGSPRISTDILDAAPGLRIIGELEGDRFAARIDVEAAAARGVRVTDTTNGSSYPVSEWALAMMLIALRNAGEQFRHLIGNEVYRRPTTDLGYVRGELTGKRVGLIGCGIIGRRLIELLKPFHCDVRVYDPYIPKEIPDIMGFLLTNLDYVMSESDVVVCLAPITPRTHRMIGQRELDLIQPGAALVNVSRGAIIDPDALIERLKRGDITGAFDVFDPEPIPADSPIRDLPNVFLTPHIAGVTAACGPRFFKLMVDELDRFLHGHETLYDLHPRVLANRRGEASPIGQR
jgi:phosphoglycerate dehydrogenase-like enzyme